MSKLEAQESSISDSEVVSESRFECPICLAWLRDPVLTSCGHRFCRLCIQSWLQREGACPVDNMKLVPATDLFPDNFTRREILQHKTVCPYNNLGCLEKISPLDIESHLANCQYKVTDIDFKKYCCLFKDAGCTANFKTDEESQDHLSKNMNYHLTLLCSVYTQLKTKYEVPNTTDKAQESFFWDPPTKDGNSSAEAESKDSLHNLLKVLYEKIVLLEQKNREQDIIITNMSQQITVNNSKLTELPLRYCNGSYLWTVKDFHSKLEAMYSDPKKMFYSNGFYTNPNGYKLCLRLNLSPHDHNYLALIVHVMKTDHDFILDWPLNARITIILIHPSIPSINIRESMLIKPELEAFRKPIQTLNPRGFGYTEFALISDLKNEGFLKNDEIHIKIQAYTA